MRDVSELAFWFLICLSLVIGRLQYGSHKLRGSIALVLVFAAGAVRWLWHVRAPISGTLEFVLTMVFVGTICILGIRGFHAGSSHGRTEGPNGS